MGKHQHIPNSIGYKTAYFSATLSRSKNKSQPTMEKRGWFEQAKKTAQN